MLVQPHCLLHKTKGLQAQNKQTTGCGKRGITRVTTILLLLKHQTTRYPEQLHTRSTKRTNRVTTMKSASAGVRVRMGPLTVKIFSPTQNTPICQIEPEVARCITHLALPATERERERRSIKSTPS